MNEQILIVTRNAPKTKKIPKKKIALVEQSPHNIITFRLIMIMNNSRYYVWSTMVTKTINCALLVLTVPIKLPWA